MNIYAESKETEQPMEPMEPMEEEEEEEGEKEEYVIEQREQINYLALYPKEKKEFPNIEQKEKNDFVLCRSNEVFLEHEEVLVNDDYNIVEENYYRPVRAYIQKMPDKTEKTVTSSDYDILHKIKKQEGQNQFRDLINETIKIKEKKITINDISGYYPKKIEKYRGTDENFEKFINDHNNINFNKNFHSIQINVNLNRKMDINYYQENNEPLKPQYYYFNRGENDIGNQKPNEPEESFLYDTYENNQ